MLRFFTYLTLFSAIAQPAALFPRFRMTERMFFVLACLTIVMFAIDRLMHGAALSRLPQRKYVYGLVVVYVLSIAQSGWLGGAVDMLLLWSKIAIVFTLVVDGSESVRDVRRLAITVVAAVAALSWMGWDLYLNSPELLHDSGRLESVGNYNLSNSFALALTIGTAFAVAVLTTAHGFLGKLFWLLPVCGFAVTCVYTKSRGGNLGLAVVIVGSILLTPSIRSRAFKGLLLAGVIVAMIASVPLILARGDVSGYFGGDVSAGDRMMVWQAGVLMILDNPLFGVGYGQFADRVVDYGSDRKMLAHNTILSVAAETGIVGGVFFVAMIVTTLWSLWRVWRLALRDTAQQDLACLAQGVMVGLVAFLVNSSFSVKDYDPMFWALLGTAGSIIVVHNRLSREIPAGPGSPADDAAAGSLALGSR